ncbi:MAG: hypothetical protein E7119_04050 [Bacteroidales bacterium]|nr:hypothetical protein [Bacteroidales bacterium]
MSQKLIILRPNSGGNGYLRLALFTGDFVKYVQNSSVSGLYIDLGDGIKDVKNIATYVNNGSLVNKGLISDWLHKKGYLEETQLLLFELTANVDDGIHIYRFIGHRNDISDLFLHAEARLKENNNQ